MMGGAERASAEFEEAITTLLSGHSNECILDAILKRIPEKDLYQAMLRVFERQNTVMAPAFPENTLMRAVGLGSTSVQGCSSANINVQPQCDDFHLDRLIISSEIADDFLVTDIKIGRNSQLASVGAIPGAAFPENVFAIKLKGTAHHDQFITVSVTNQTPSTRNFQGVLIGHTDSPAPARRGDQADGMLNPYGD